MTEIELNEKIAEIRSTAAADARLQEKASRRNRYIARVRKNDAIMRITNYGRYAPHVGYIDWGFDGQTLLHSGKYIKYPKNSNCQRWIKKETSHRMRHCPDAPRKGNYYRRLFDYWWTLY